MTEQGLRPPIPLSLAHRPVRGGLAQPWINAELADGGSDFRSTHRTRYEQAWEQSLCQSCGNPTGPRAVLVCGPRQILTGRYDEAPACPPCALYASRACPMVAGRVEIYPDRPRVVEGHRGGTCPDPSCGCGGWLNIDEEHSADMGGQPVLPWYAAWVRAGEWQLTGHVAKYRCSDLGCEHERVMINGAQLLASPLKVVLISEPGTGRIWRTLTADEGARARHCGASESRCVVTPVEDRARMTPERFADLVAARTTSSGDAREIMLAAEEYAAYLIQEQWSRPVPASQSRRRAS